MDWQDDLLNGLLQSTNVEDRRNYDVRRNFWSGKWVDPKMNAHKLQEHSRYSSIGGEMAGIGPHNSMEDQLDAMKRQDLNPRREADIERASTGDFWNAVLNAMVNSVTGIGKDFGKAGRTIDFSF